MRFDFPHNQSYASETIYLCPHNIKCDKFYCSELECGITAKPSFELFEDLFPLDRFEISTNFPTVLKIYVKVGDIC